MRRLLSLVLLLLSSTQAWAQANGKLQIHYMDVGQADAAVLISPQGEVVLFDNGSNSCIAVGYLQSLGVTKIDYHIASHYHSDHIGCTPNLLAMFPLQKAAYDRGGTYTTAAFTAYVNAVGAKRVTAQKGQTITLDAGSANPATITFVALNGNGTATTDENDLSLVAVVRFGQFDAEFGGDLSGSNSGIVDPDPSAPTPTCTYSISPTSQSPGTGATSFGVTVTTSSGCAWTATSNASWIAVTGPANGSGSGSTTLAIAANSGAARSGAATIAGKTLTVNQAGVSLPPDACTTTPPSPSNTAQCKDGTWSSSQNRGGTCSTHGGVACWVCPGILCSALMSITSNSYADIETSVGSLVGQIEVYKVHHHGSKYSSNNGWLTTTTPKVGIISVGAGNSYGHPTPEALSRLHTAGIKTYWTSAGNGAPLSSGQDVIAGNTIVEVSPGATTFTVRYGATTDTFTNWGATGGLPPGPPFGSFDTPAPNATIAGEIGVTGWALDNSNVTSVKVYRNPVAGEGSSLVFIGDATFVPGARPDVAGTYANYPNAGRAGWGYMLLSNFLPNGGNGTFIIHAIATDDSGTSTTLGQRTIIAQNSTSAIPFGTIDTPGQGQTVSGVIANFGWALTPPPGFIPTDGSTINVFIDNTFVGHPTYNNFRSDIAALFPGYPNSNGAVGAFILDTTTLTNGVHTIFWVVTDNRGNSQGIGSRFFTVQNVPVTPTLPSPPVPPSPPDPPSPPAPPNPPTPPIVEGLVPGGDTLHVNLGDPVLITTTRTGSTTELIQIVGTKNPNGIATGITGLRAFDVNEPTKYDEVTLTHERLPAAIVLRDGSLVEYDYTEPGTVGMKISLADGTIETTSFPFTTPNATLVPITLPATTAPSSVSARILNVRARVFELSGAPVNDAHVSGDWDEGRDPNGNPRIGQFSTMRTADGTYETSISLEPTPPPILENLANNAQSVCQTIQQHTSNVCQFLDPIKGLAWELAAIQACLATLPNPALAAACVTAATTVKLFCANTGQVCKLLAFMIDLFPKGPVLLHTQASGPLFFKNDQQMVTLPYPDPVAVDFTIPNRPAAEERAVLGEAPFDSIITWTATRNDLPCWPGESNGSTDIYKVFHGVSYEPLVPLLRKWGKWVPASASKPSPTGSLTSSLDATGVVTTIFVDTQTYVSGTSTDTWDYQITETVDLNKGYYSRDYIGHRVMISHTWCGVSKWEAFDHGTQNGPLPVTMVPIAK